MIPFSSLDYQVLNLVKKAGTVSAADLIIRLMSKADRLIPTLRKLAYETHDLKVWENDADFEALLKDLERIEKSGDRTQLRKYVKEHQDSLDRVTLAASSSGFAKVSS